LSAPYDSDTPGASTVASATAATPFVTAAMAGIAGSVRPALLLTARSVMVSAAVTERQPFRP
jgi:hypothetical protein